MNFAKYLIVLLALAISVGCAQPTCSHDVHLCACAQIAQPQAPSLAPHTFKETSS